MTWKEPNIMIWSICWMGIFHLKTTFLCPWPPSKDEIENILFASISLKLLGLYYLYIVGTQPNLKDWLKAQKKGEYLLVVLKKKETRHHRNQGAGGRYLWHVVKYLHWTCRRDDRPDLWVAKSHEATESSSGNSRRENQSVIRGQNWADDATAVCERA